MHSRFLPRLLRDLLLERAERRVAGVLVLRHDELDLRLLEVALQEELLGATRERLRRERDRVLEFAAVRRRRGTLSRRARTDARRLGRGLARARELGVVGGAELGIAQDAVRFGAALEDLVDRLPFAKAPMAVRVGVERFGERVERAADVVVLGGARELEELVVVEQIDQREPVEERVRVAGHALQSRRLGAPRSARPSARSRPRAP